MSLGRASRKQAAPRRRGAILLQAVFLLLVLMGLVGLVVDMGIARASQTYMQASSDAAAIEGLRLRDALLLTDPVQSDFDRRTSASRAASLVFDEDLDLSTGPAAFLLGAGPQLDTGVAGVHDPAGGLLVDQGPYLPVLELNAANNEVHGDLVAGSFASTDPLDPGNPDWHAEDGTYARFDFAPAPAVAAPAATAFLARLRRTNDRLGLDRQPGTSSAGPTLPFLFALGSGVLNTNDPATYDPRRDGITVRATSIADARRAVAVGIMGPSTNGVAVVGTDVVNPSLARVLAFDDASWQNDFVVDGPFQVLVGTDGAILGAPGGPTPTASGLAQPAAGLVRVGDVALLATTPGSVAVPVSSPGLLGLRYVALFSVAAAGPRITGFAAVEIDSAIFTVAPNGTTVLAVAGRKLASVVAPENASAVPALATDLTALLPPSPARQPLLAPVLAR